MKLTFLFTLLFVSTSDLLFSQFKKIPFDTSFYWRQSSISMPSETVSGCTFQYQVKYRKDTLILGKVYGKFSLFGGTIGSIPCGASFISTGYLRQDTLLKKVTILDNNNVERPLYNFTKGVGDTMQIYQKNINSNITVTVTGVDSLLFNDGKYHKRQSVFATGQYSDSFYEELGAVFGGLFAQYNMINNSEFQAFQCYGKTSRTFTVLYNASGYPCSLIPLSLTEQSDQKVHELYPNPNNGIFKIRSTDDLKNVKIYNFAGQLVYAKENVNSNNVDFDLKDLPVGIYYLKIDLSVGVEYAKFVKSQ